MAISESQLKEEFIHFSQIADGVTDAGRFRGAYNNETIFYIKKYFNKIEFIAPNTNFYFDPNNPSTLLVCAPAGGIWKSPDAGLSWTSNTDLLPNLGVSDIAIDPSNSDIMFIATGDRDAGDTYSYGVMKSQDGGLSWDSTGLSFLYITLT